MGTKTILHFKKGMGKSTTNGGKSITSVSVGRTWTVGRRAPSSPCLREFKTQLNYVELNKDHWSVLVLCTNHNPGSHYYVFKWIRSAYLPSGTERRPATSKTNHLKLILKRELRPPLVGITMGITASHWIICRSCWEVYTGNPPTKTEFHPLYWSGAPWQRNKYY